MQIYLCGKRYDEQIHCSLATFDVLIYLDEGELQYTSKNIKHIVKLINIENSNKKMAFQIHNLNEGKTDNGPFQYVQINVKST